MQKHKILLGITGGIAAYKSILLIRLLLKNGYEVKVIITDSVKDFIGINTLQALTHNQVYETFTTSTGAWNNHVGLGLWADVLLVVPATANTISKLANGHCDNLLVATYLSARCITILAPAMDIDMWKHPSTQDNINKLEKIGNTILYPNKGVLASGLEGEGRVQEPEEILQYIEKYFAKKQDFYTKKILITAGPTYEKIDPVRFIGNFSSGKMGIAIAEELASRGANVFLVCGPSSIPTYHTNIQRIDVVSADEMYAQCMSLFSSVDIAILCAAVADYKPVNMAVEKIKKTDDNLIISLVPNKDILKTLGETKTHQLVIGFALETNNELHNATAKLERKKADAIILNSLQEQGAGFQVDTNKITIVDVHKNIHEYPLASKKEVATYIADFILTIPTFHNKTT